MDNNKSRPLSPHLLIYKPQMTSMLSILHRMTGVVLSMGLLFFTLMVSLTLFDRGLFSLLESVLFSWFGMAFLAAWSGSFFYHLLAGIRHLFWDAGHGFDLEIAAKSGWGVVIASLIMTVAYMGLLYA